MRTKPSPFSKRLSPTLRQRRSRLLRAEPLESRTMLASLPDYLQVSAPWFAATPLAYGPQPEWQLSSGADHARSQDWIVRLSSQALTDHATTTPQAAAELLYDFAASVNFYVVTGLGLPGQLLVRASSSDATAVAAALAGNPNVASFGPNDQAVGLATPNDPRFSDQTHLNNVGQDGGTPGADIHVTQAWDVTTGDPNLVVAVIDSGVDMTHPDLYLNVFLNAAEIPTTLINLLPTHSLADLDADGDGLVTIRDLNAPLNRDRQLAPGVKLVTDGNANGFIDAADILSDPRWADGLDTDANGYGDDYFGWDFVNNDNAPFDDHGHGTHVAGILAARGGNGVGVTGVAQQASLLPLKFLDAANQGDTAGAILAFNYATALRERQPTLDRPANLPAQLRVANASWGAASSSGDPNLRSAISVAGDAGILVVAGAGNGDLLGRGVNMDDAPFFPASFDLPNILSVGASDSNDQLARFSNFGPSSVDLVAPGAGILSTELGGGYGTRNGTSMATPQVSGVAILVLAAHPEATVAEVSAALRSSVTVLPQLAGSSATGGRLNALGAINAETFAPRAELLSATNVNASNANQPVTLRVRYVDTNDINLATLDANDLVVKRRGFSGFDLFVQSASLEPGGSAREATVSYTVLPRSPLSWRPEDMGTYDISIRAKQIADVTGLESGARVIGQFAVNVPNVLGSIFVVNSVADTGDANLGDGLAHDSAGRTTLRAAVQEANALGELNQAESIVLLPEGVYALERSGRNEDQSATGDLDIFRGHVQIYGAGAGKTVIDGRRLDRIFDVLGLARLDLFELTVTGGQADDGGGIRNAAELHLNGVEVTANQAQRSGGGVYSGAVLQTVGSTIANNSTTEGFSNLGGGGLYNAGNASIATSSIVNNRTAAGLATVGGGGGIYNSVEGQAGLNGVTVSGNIATNGDGGGIWNAGTLDLLSNTITSNSALAGAGGGIFNNAAADRPQFLKRFGENGQPFEDFLEPQIAIDSAGRLAVLESSLDHLQLLSPTLTPLWQRSGTQPAAGDGIRFANASDVAFDAQGRILIKDNGFDRILIFSALGEPVQSIPLPSSSSDPSLKFGKLAVDASGSIHVSVNAHQIQSFNSAGQFVSSTTLPIDISAAQAILSPTGSEFFVVLEGSITAYSRAGAFLRTIVQFAPERPLRDASLNALGQIVALIADNSADFRLDTFQVTGQLLASQPLPSFLSAAHSLALEANGGVYLASSYFGGEPGIAHVGPAGETLESYGRLGGFRYPRGLAVGINSEDRIYSTATLFDRVEVFGEDGRRLLQFGSTGSGPGELRNPSGIAVNSSETLLYVVDTGNQRIQIFTTDGAYLNSFGSEGSGPGEFQFFTGRTYPLQDEDSLTILLVGIAVDDATGDVYVADSKNHRVQVFSPTGALLRSFGASGVAPGEFGIPVGIAIAGDRVYVSEVAENGSPGTASANNRVQAFDKQGNFLFAFQGGPGLLIPGGIAAAGEKIYVSEQLMLGGGMPGEPGGLGVLVYDRDGNFLHAFGELTNGEGGFVEPHSVAFGSKRLYVADDNDRIQSFLAPQNGAQSMQATILANNVAATSPDAFGRFLSDGTNLIGDVTGTQDGADQSFPLDLQGNQDSPLDPQLAPLAADGSGRLVHTPLPGSRVIDVLGPGPYRDGDGDGLALQDIGAVEYFATELRGLKYLDLNGDGQRQAGEPGLAGFVIFADFDADGVLDFNEPRATTQADDPRTSDIDETGRYFLTGLVPLSAPYRLVDLPTFGFVPSAPQFIRSSAPAISALVTSSTLTPSLSPVGSLRTQAGIVGNNLLFQNERGDVYQLDAATGQMRLRLEISTLANEPIEVGRVVQDGSQFALLTKDRFARPTIVSVDSAEVRSVVADVNTFITPTQSKFSTLQEPRLQDGTVTFAGNGSEPDISDSFPRDAGVFAWRDGSLVHLANRSNETPDTMPRNSFLQFGDLEYSQSRFAFTASSFTPDGLASELTGIYLGSDPQTLSKVVDSLTAVPGGSGNFRKNSFDFRFSGERIMFHAIDDATGQDGLYLAYLDSTPIDISLIASEFFGIEGTSVSVSSYAAPGQPAQFAMQYDPFSRNASQSVMAFVGYGDDGYQAIFTNIRGDFEVLADTSQLIDGKQPVELSVGPQAISGSRIVYHVKFSDGSQAIYQAEYQADHFYEVNAGPGVTAGFDFGSRALPGTITGQVFEDANGDRRQTEEQEPSLAGWTVFLDDNGDGVLNVGERSALTAADGSYTFVDLPALTTYGVTLQVQAGFNVTLPAGGAGRRSVALGAQATVRKVDFGVQRQTTGGVSAEGILRGKLFNDVNGNGLQDAGELGIAGRTVYLDVNNPGTLDLGERFTISQSDNPGTPEDETGNYAFLQLPTNKYTVRVVDVPRSEQTAPRDNKLTETVLTSGNAVQAIVVGDFNYDHKPDLALALTARNHVEIQFGNGDGTFTLGPTFTVDSPQSLAVGDLDGDGQDDDLVVGSQKGISLANPQGQIFVFRNDGNSAGHTTAFATPEIYAAGGIPQALIVAKLNGDNKADIVVVNQDFTATRPEFTNLSVFLSDSSSRLQNPVRYNTGGGPRDVVAADLDGQNGLDLAVTNSFVSNNASSLSIYRNNGAGGFTPEAAPILVGKGALGIAAARLNRDGKIDLVTANLVDKTVSILLNTTTSGAISFARSDQSVGDAPPQRVIAVDIDGDQDSAGNKYLDLAVSNAADRNLTILRNQGNGTFAGPQSAGVLAGNNGVGYAVAALDFDGNQSQDLVVSRGETQGLAGEFSGSVSLFRNQVLAKGAQRAFLPLGTEAIGELNFGLRTSNNPPTINQPIPLQLPEDAGIQTIDLAGIGPGVGEAGQSFAVEVSTDNAALITNLSLEYVPGATTGRVRFTPAANKSGFGNILVLVRDAGVDGLLGNSDDLPTLISIGVQVTSANDPAPSADDEFTVPANSQANLLEVLANDRLLNPDIGETLTIELVTPFPASQGTLSTVQKDHLLFTPAAGFVGDVTFTYYVSDGSSLAQASVIIHVLDGNAFPWHNPVNAFDVTGESPPLVNIDDALAIIRQLRRSGAGAFPVADHPPPYYDVVADNQLQISDALAVISELRRIRATGGEGESSEPAISPPSVATTSQAFDLALLSLLTEAKKTRQDKAAF